MTQQSTKPSGKHESRPRIAFFPGSFNPFTKGHASIVDRALRLFDSVVIGIGCNTAKGAESDTGTRAEAIRQLYADEPRVRVTTFSGLAVDAARNAGACCAVKGIRSVKDFEYERDLADINRSISGLDTIILPAEPHLAMISSSMVRELQRYGKDISQYLP